MIGRVVAVSADGKRLTVQKPQLVKGGPAPQVVVQISAPTKLTYENVGPDGARPLAGYTAFVWLEKESSEAAAEVLLRGPGTTSKGHFLARVLAVSADSKQLTLVSIEKGMPARGKNGEPLPPQVSCVFFPAMSMKVVSGLFVWIVMCWCPNLATQTSEVLQDFGSF